MITGRAATGSNTPPLLAAAARPIGRPPRGADLAGGERRPEFGEQRPVGLAVARALWRSERVDALTQRHPRTPPPARLFAGGPAPRAPRAGEPESAPGPARAAGDSALR